MKLTKQYFTLSKENREGNPMFITARANFSTGQLLHMLTGNKELALTFKSEQEAFDYHNFNLSHHPQFVDMDIIPLNSLYLVK